MSVVRLLLLLLSLVASFYANAQVEKDMITKNLSIHSNIKYDKDSAMFYLEKDGKRHYEKFLPPFYSVENMMGNPRGTSSGIALDFKNPSFTGILYYGFIPYKDTKHPQPVFFGRTASITNGKAEINIRRMGGVYDMIDWRANQKGTLGYRIVANDGRMLYEGKVGFKGKGPFTVDVTLIEEPMINAIGPDSAIISFTTNIPIKAKVKVGNKTIKEKTFGTRHEITVKGLKPYKEYKYTVYYGDNQQHYSFETAPVKGTRKPFTFAYASDSRSGKGGGERSMYGANVYIMKKIMALTYYKKSKFLQFSGDLIDGYLSDVPRQEIQFLNWKRSVEPFAHYLPIYTSMGNHEALIHVFKDPKESRWYRINRMGTDTAGAEAVYGKHFVNPTNGPISEDGAYYDPDKDNINFPSYKENVYHYTYDNVAVIVLNTDYWYAPTTHGLQYTSGNMHGFILDQQLAWLQNLVKKFEEDQFIDHVFLTLHTPFFPNGGHVGDDMWYSGNNEYRPTIAGKPHRLGILERRDQLLDILMNQSSKVRAILTGDEHNYCTTKIDPGVNIYPDNHKGPKVKLSRTIYQINNGAAGAPYYSQQKTPWSKNVSGFTTQNALVFIHVNGGSVEVEVVNPDTLEPLHSFKIR